MGGENRVERIALISDIHGNLPALVATLADIEQRGVTRIFCLGDLAGKGPHGDVTVDICRERCEQVVRGNWDDGLAQGPNFDPVLRWHRDRLGPDRLAYLLGLPNALDLTLSGQHVRLLHASPHGVHVRVHQHDPEEKLRAMFDNTEFTGFDSEPDVVGYGDIHEAYVRTFEMKTLFNVGSVGNPLDQPMACYAILEGTGDGDGPGPLSIMVVRLPYDIERAIDDAAAEGMPELQPYAVELRTAQFQRRMTKTDEQ
jgi:protein phosphatase